MSNFFWKSPSDLLILDDVNKIEIFRVVDQNIISELDWPASFWLSISEKTLLDREATEKVLSLFKALKVGNPKRCHMPPWGIAIYDTSGLIYTVTVCFECTNCYVYSSAGGELRAFEMPEISATELLDYFAAALPLN